VKPVFNSLPPPPFSPSLRASMENRTFGADCLDVDVDVGPGDDSLSLIAVSLDIFEERISWIFPSAWGYLEKRVSLES